MRTISILSMVVVFSGTATFEGVNLGRYGTKEGTVSGSIAWECASVQRL